VALLAGSATPANGVDGPEPALPKDRSLGKMILAYGLFGFGYVVTATFLVAIVRQGGGGRVFEAAVWMVAGLAGFPSVWFWQKLAGRIGLY
ncbi:MAG: YbfB/YjiJ family MFS transporter, partial [Mesorhizobium sp.]